MPEKHKKSIEKNIKKIFRYFMNNFINKIIDKITDLLARKMEREKAARLVELACFCVVGGINTLVDTGIYSLIFYLILNQNHALDPIAYIPGYIGGIVCSFILNKVFTFRDKGAAKTQWLPFLLVNGVSLLVGLGCKELLGLAMITGFVAKLITIPVTLAINYLGSKIFVFKK